MNSTEDTAGGVTQVGAKPQFQKAQGKRRSRKARSLLKPGRTAFPSEGGELKLNSERKEQRPTPDPVPPGEEDDFEGMHALVSSSDDEEPQTADMID